MRLKIVELSMGCKVFNIHFTLHTFGLEDVGDSGHVIQSGYRDQVTSVLRNQSV
jgi:hypothetical protein